MEKRTESAATDASLESADSGIGLPTGGSGGNSWDSSIGLSTGGVGGGISWDENSSSVGSSGRKSEASLRDNAVDTKPPPPQLPPPCVAATDYLGLKQPDPNIPEQIDEFISNFIRRNVRKIENPQYPPIILILRKKTFHYILHYLITVISLVFNISIYYIKSAACSQTKKVPRT